MSHRILIVEDESLVAMELEATLDDMGHQGVGIAADSGTALRLVEKAPEIALVDINLRDGPTGIALGARLSQDFGLNVLYVTVNPKSLGDGVPGTIGVLPKPYTAEDGEAALNLVTKSGQAPAPMKVFARRATG